MSVSIPEWRIIRANLTSGLMENLHSKKQLIKFAKESGIDELVADYEPTDQTTIPDFEEVLLRARERRYAQPGRPRPAVDPDPKRVFAVEDHFPCASKDSVALAGTDLYRVVPHTSLAYLIDISFWDKPEVLDLDLALLPDRSSVEDIQEWCESLAELPEAERSFTLPANGRLTNGIVWFSPYEDIPNVLSSCNSDERAKRIRDYLGLVHHCPPTDPSPTHLFGLTFSGDAADVVGHYRPCALDSLDNARFMVPKAAPDPWGSTADLEAVAAGTLPLNGAPERVANQIWKEDFNNTLIRFEYLGMVDEPHMCPNLDFAQLLEATI